MSESNFAQNPTPLDSNEQVSQNLPNSNLIKVNVKLISGKTVQISIAPATSVSDLKTLLEPLVEIPKNTQRLLFRGKMLKDEENLQALGVENENVMHCVSRPPPQPENTSSQPTSASQPGEGAPNRTTTRRGEVVISSFVVPGGGIGISGTGVGVGDSLVNSLLSSLMGPNFMSTNPNPNNSPNPTPQTVPQTSQRRTTQQFRPTTSTTSTSTNLNSSQSFPSNQSSWSSSTNSKKPSSGSKTEKHLQISRPPAAVGQSINNLVELFQQNSLKLTRMGVALENKQTNNNELPPTFSENEEKQLDDAQQTLEMLTKRIESVQDSLTFMRGRKSPSPSQPSSSSSRSINSSQNNDNKKRIFDGVQLHVHTTAGAMGDLDNQIPNLENYISKRSRSSSNHHHHHHNQQPTEGPHSSSYIPSPTTTTTTTTTSTKDEKLEAQPTPPAEPSSSSSTGSPASSSTFVGMRLGDVFETMSKQLDAKIKEERKKLKKKKKETSPRDPNAIPLEDSDQEDISSPSSSSDEEEEESEDEMEMFMKAVLGDMNIGDLMAFMEGDLSGFDNQQTFKNLQNFFIESSNSKSNKRLKLSLSGDTSINNVLQHVNDVIQQLQHRFLDHPNPKIFECFNFANPKLKNMHGDEVYDMMTRQIFKFLRTFLLFLYQLVIHGPKLMNSEFSEFFEKFEIQNKLKNEILRIAKQKNLSSTENFKMSEILSILMELFCGNLVCVLADFCTAGGESELASELSPDSRNVLLNVISEVFDSFSDKSPPQTHHNNPQNTTTTNESFEIHNSPFFFNMRLMETASNQMVSSIILATAKKWQKLQPETKKNDFLKTENAYNLEKGKQKVEKMETEDDVHIEGLDYQNAIKEKGKKEEKENLYEKFKGILKKEDKSEKKEEKEASDSDESRLGRILGMDTARQWLDIIQKDEKNFVKNPNFKFSLAYELGDSLNSPRIEEDVENNEEIVQNQEIKKENIENQEIKKENIENEEETEDVNKKPKNEEEKEEGGCDSDRAQPSGGDGVPLPREQNTKKRKFEDGDQSHSPHRVAKRRKQQ